MKYSEIDRIHKRLSFIGLGCVTFGREIDSDTSFGLMDFAISNGITLFDTAAAYGNGASEKIIGNWIKLRKQISSSIIVSTKILPPFNSKTLEKSVDTSLKRLDSPVDILYLHRWEKEIEDYSFLKMLDLLVKSGKVESIGISNINLVQLKRIIKIQRKFGLTRFSVIQNNNNYAVSGVNDETKIFCKRQGLTIITYSPLGAGFLTGKYQNEIPVGSRFSLIPGHQQIYFRKGPLNRLSTLTNISSMTGYSTTFLSLLWAIHQKGIGAVLVGGRNIAQLELALTAEKFNDDKVLKQLGLD